MPGPSAVSSRAASKPNPSVRRKRDHAEFDTIPESSSPPSKPSEVVDLTTDGTHTSRKQRRVGPSTSTIPRTLPTEPHEELLAELKGKYEIMTTSIISSSKINNKVTAVLSHLGHVDLFSQDSRPGVMMLHARAADASKMVTVMEIAKRRMGEIGQVWYQYNRVYEVTEAARGDRASSIPHGAGRTDGTQTVIEDTVLENDDEEDESFEPLETPFDLAVRNKPATESKNTYMSMFLSRVPMPELQAKASFTLQTNAGQHT